jgi:uncharacterized protein with von Willebrand factor type A (vWA) domain
MRQYFYLSIHPRTISQVGGSFKTALKALMWLTDSFAQEIKKRKHDEKQLMTIGLSSDKPTSGSEQADVSERLTDKQIEQMKLVGYTLQMGKRKVEEKQAALDTRPLVAAEVQALKMRIDRLQEEMRTDFMKRDKLRQKLRKAEEELQQRNRQLERMDKRESETMVKLEEQLGDWLGRSLKETLSKEDTATFDVSELLKASQQIANRRWGSDLGKLHRQQYERYMEWIERLKRHPELVTFLQEVGRSVRDLRAKRRLRRDRQAPDSYDDLRQSGDISHMLPSEASLLADPDYEAYFTVKWLDRKLLTYQLNGWEEEPQKGPVICMLDTSYSMRGSKLRLAQLFTAAFAAFAMLEKRDFTLLLFGAKGELIERTLQHRKPDWPAFYSLSQLAFGGGTHFDAPMKRGIELVNGSRAYGSADFVMVTDGIGHLSPPVRDMLMELGAKKQVRLHSLIVGNPRQHLAEKYDILGVSHNVRFASSWESQDDQKGELLLDVFS